VIPVKAYGNCDEVELFLNGTSLGRKPMPRNGSITWNVTYRPGTLVARGFTRGHEIVADKVETTGAPAAIQLTSDVVPNLAVSELPTLIAGSRDATVVAVRINDDQGRNVPTAQTHLAFSIEGPGRIIAVANGDPACHESDQFLPSVRNLRIRDWRVLESGAASADPVKVSGTFDDSGWRSVFSGLDQPYPTGLAVFRGSVRVDTPVQGGKIVLFLPPLGESESVYLNGRLLADKLGRADAYRGIALDAALLASGDNTIAVVAQPLGRPPRAFDYTSPGEVQVVTPAGTWSRSAFNGLAAVIVQATGGLGEINLRAGAPGLPGASLKILAR
jgi:beta-galactosidase